LASLDLSIQAKKGPKFSAAVPLNNHLLKLVWLEMREACGVQHGPQNHLAHLNKLLEYCQIGLKEVRKLRTPCHDTNLHNFIYKKINISCAFYIFS
jgi:hypothetical protein